MSRRDRPGPPEPCPCGSGAGYAACCGRWHAGAPAPSAEVLMRSRYAAYALGRTDYVLDTWHASTRPPAIDPDSAGTRWLGLEVRAVRAQGDARATVEFVARCRVDGRGRRLHEVSRFVREAGRWWYVGGEWRTAAEGAAGATGAPDGG